MVLFRYSQTENGIVVVPYGSSIESRRNCIRYPKALIAYSRINTVSYHQGILIRMRGTQFNNLRWYSPVVNLQFVSIFNEIVWNQRDILS